MASLLLQVAFDDVTKHETSCTRSHAGVVHHLKGKGGSYPLEVVPLLWLRTSSFRSLSGKAHGQLESELEGALAVHASSSTDVRVLTLISRNASQLLNLDCAKNNQRLCCYY